MLKILKPILLAFLSSSAIKQLIVDLLKEICKKTSNDVDDKAVFTVDSDFITSIAGEGNIGANISFSFG